MGKIDKQKIKRRIKRKLRMTLGAKIAIVMALMIIAFISFSVISTRFIFFQMAILMEVDHVYATGKTALGVSGTDNSEKLCEIVKDIYVSIPEQEKGKQNSHDYLSEFPDITAEEYDIDYSRIDFVFDVISETNDSVTNVGLCLLDQDTQKVIIVRDDKGSHCGLMEKFNFRTGIALDETIPLYSDRISRGEKALRIIDLRVLIPLKENDNGSLRQCLFVDVHDDNIGVMALIFVMAYVIVFALVALAIWIVISIIVKRSIIRPITRLSNAADDWAQAPNKMEEKYYFRDLKIRANDEVRDLKDAMETMETEIHDYLVGLEKATEEKLRLSSELEVTAKLQANMLPEKLESNDKSFSLFPFMRPARVVGGDFYDFFMINDNMIGLVIADVSDKGVPASLFMVVSRTILKNEIKEKPEDIEAAMEKANRGLCENNKDMMFVTAFVGIYDLRTRMLSYVNAGHEDLIVYEKEADRYRVVNEEHDILLGIYENAKFNKKQIELKAGDRLFMYTDGVTEAMDISENLFGIDKLINVLNKDTSLEGDAMLNELWNEISTYQAGKNQADDVTMLLFEV